MMKEAFTSAIKGGADDNARIWIECVQPQVNGGEFPIKRTVGESVQVSADIFTDGDDCLQAVICYRTASEARWTEVPMSCAGNDSWRGEFKIQKREPYFYTIAAWIDSFGTWKRALKSKIRAKQDIGSELRVGAHILDELMHCVSDKDIFWLDKEISVLEEGRETQRLMEFIDSKRLQNLYAHCSPRRMLCEYEQISEVWIDRERARCGAWYQMGLAEAKFGAAIAQLNLIADMGFDVVALPPVQTPGAGISPDALTEISNHRTLNPELGTEHDFLNFVAKSQTLKLELALELDFECSAEHPYRTQHPDWFASRFDTDADEHVCKKLNPLNFESENWEEIWVELKSLVNFWIEKGIKIFSISRPDTKPLSFWAWLIHEIQLDHSDVIFVAEEVVRPKMAAALFKVGFAQSRSWVCETTLRELVEGCCSHRETEKPRRNLSVRANASDSELVVAATLGATYSISADGGGPNRQTFFAQLNYARKQSPALQYAENGILCSSSNPKLLAYLKGSLASQDAILIVVNSEPAVAHEGIITIPEEAGIFSSEGLIDLLSDERHACPNSRLTVSFAPEKSPARLLKLL